MPRLPILLSALTVLPATTWADAPQVLVDTPALHAITAQVMAGVGTPDLLLPPGASPHDYALRPSDAAALYDAQVIFWVGPGLTQWLGEPINALGAEATIVALLETKGWETRPLRDWDDGHDHGAADHDDHDDHDDDDHEGPIDPHAWLDPLVASDWAATIADTLATQDPDNAAQYLANAQSVEQSNAQLISDISAQLAPFSGQGYVVPHDAFQYFETRFNMPASGTISLSDAQTPTPRALAALRDEIRHDQISCVLTDAQTNPDWAKLVSEGTDAQLVPADPEGALLPPGPELYDALLRNLANALETCLSPS